MAKTNHWELEPELIHYIASGRFRDHLVTKVHNPLLQNVQKSKNENAIANAERKIADIVFVVTLFFMRECKRF